MATPRPVYTAGLDYVNGLRLSWLTGTTMSVAAGACRNSSNVNDIVLDEAVTIDTAVNGAGGLDIGTIANSTLYAVYVIGDTFAHKSPSALISADLDQPLLPRDYNMYRRVGVVKTSGAGALLEFYQIGNDKNRWMKYDAGIEVLNAGNSAVYAAVDLSDHMPEQQTDVLLNLAFTPNGAADTMALKPTGASSVDGHVTIDGAAAGVLQQLNQVCDCNDAASIDYKVTAAGALTLNLLGYLDQL